MSEMTPWQKCIFECDHQLGCRCRDYAIYTILLECRSTGRDVEGLLEDMSEHTGAAIMGYTNEEWVEAVDILMEHVRQMDVLVDGTTLRHTDFAWWRTAYPRLSLEPISDGWEFHGHRLLLEGEGEEELEVFEELPYEDESDDQYCDDGPRRAHHAALHAAAARVLERRPDIVWVELGSPDDGGSREDYDWDVPDGDYRDGLAVGFVLTREEYLGTLATRAPRF